MDAIDILIIGGSGAYFIEKKLLGKFIKTVSADTPFGKSSPIHVFEQLSERFGFLSRHGEKGYNLTAPFVNYRANIYAAKLLGVKRIISWTGPGAISKNLKPGDFVIPSDIIDFTKSRKTTFFENKGLGFIRQNPLFCPEMTDILKKMPFDGFKVHKSGIYVCTEGPRLETKAEIDFFKVINGDMVGMTLVPEVFLSKELEICYASICYITNYAEGVKPLKYKKGELFEGTLPPEEKLKVDKCINYFPEIIKNLLSLMKKERKCPCKDSMLRYKKRGDISKNWKSWF